MPIPPNHSQKSAADAAPAIGAAAVTLADADLAVIPTRALFVGTAGNLKVTMASGDVVTLTNVQAGALLPLSVTRVWLTGTTAGSVTALY